MRSLALTLILAAGPAAAQGDIDCATAVVQMEMNWCAEQDYLAADAALNEAYAAAMEALAGFEGRQAELLRDAQRAWIGFRDAACSAEGSLYEGGSIQPLMGTLCMTRLTEERTGDLRSHAETASQ